VRRASILYGEDFLIERPMLAACAPRFHVLLIDESIGSDQEFEAFLPRIPSISRSRSPNAARCAPRRSGVILTSNRTRDCTKRCGVAVCITGSTIPTRARSPHRDAARLECGRGDRPRRRQGGRQAAAEPLSKAPGIAEAIDWAEGRKRYASGWCSLARRIQARNRRRLKDEEDLAFISGRLDALIARVAQ